tara:strand:+ start:32353 stop:32490 length:138 start_codon:yes stop_codon:yes gene_type:complete
MTKRKPTFISEANHKKVRKEAYKREISMAVLLNLIIEAWFAPVDK